MKKSTFQKKVVHFLESVLDGHLVRYESMPIDPCILTNWSVSVFLICANGEYWDIKFGVLGGDDKNIYIYDEDKLPSVKANKEYLYYLLWLQAREQIPIRTGFDKSTLDPHRYS